MTGRKDNKDKLNLGYRYAEFIVEHHRTLKILGGITVLSSVPVGIGANVMLDLHPTLTSMAVAGVGVTEYSLGIAGEQIANEQSDAG